MALPVYLAVPNGPVLDALTRLLPRARRVEWPPAAECVADLEPGLILLGGSEVPLSEVVRVSSGLPAGGGGWRLAYVETAAAPPTVRSLSIGVPHDIAPLAEPNAELSDRFLMDLNGALAQIARVRHDLNNPLTSALAEAQLALLDAGDGEVRDGLEVIQTQLRRLRDMIADTNHLRPFTD